MSNAMYYMNGANASVDRGWVGYTGGNNYVVRYSFTTDSDGASSVGINLSNIWTKQGGSQTFGFKISANSLEYVNARNITPDSNAASLVYDPSTGYTASLVAGGLNLKPDTTYFMFVFCCSSGTEYYQGWNLKDPTISQSGSYTPTTSSIASITENVTTLDNVVITMDNPGNLTHVARFYYGQTLLATSDQFTTTLSYTCPRSWFSNNISVTEMSISVTVTGSTGGAETKSFTLTADAGMVPHVPYGEQGYYDAVAFSRINTGSLDAFISTLTKIQTTFTKNNIDLSATASAQLREIWIEYNGEQITTPQTGTDNVFRTGAITGSGTVTCFAKDSRDRVGSYTYNFIAFPYTIPTLKDVTVLRWDGSAESQTGTGLKVNATTVSTSLTGYQNTASIKAYYKETSADVYTECATHPVSGTDKIYSNIFNQNKTYMVKLAVSDAAGGSKSYEYSLAYEEWMLCFTADGDGAGIGKIAENANELQLPTDWVLSAGGAKFGRPKMVLIEGQHYGSTAQRNALTPVEGQIFFVLAT